MDAESLDIFGLHHPDTVIFHRTQLWSRQALLRSQPEDVEGFSAGPGEVEIAVASSQSLDVSKIQVPSP